VISARTISAAAAFTRHVGAEEAARKARDGVWSTSVYFALRCDLAQLPEKRAAAVPLTMTARDCASFHGFQDELPRTGPDDYLQVMLRVLWCEAGVNELFVGDGPDGQPAYCQWLVRARDQWPLQRHSPGRYPALRDDEVLLEGAYTFSAYRRKGAMADGMHQLLEAARDEGARTALTYVADDNVASLRGCAAVGFGPDHLTRNDRRIGVRRSHLEPLTPEAWTRWNEATAQRPRPPAAR
jgi:hypothetical protein